jgi:drug/metabolite transporter (DMT)-like permease
VSPGDRRTVSSPWLAAAVGASAAVILSAPWAGQLRAWLRETFPESFSAIFTGGVLLAVGAALLFAIARIQHRRLPRYALMATAIILAVFQGWLFTPSNESTSSSTASSRCCSTAPGAPPAIRPSS